MIDATRLYAEAEVKAERTVALLRIAVALMLGVGFLTTVAGTAYEGIAPAPRQHVIAVATIGSYFVLGVVSRWLANSTHFRPWMSWLFVTVDVSIIVGSLVLGLLNTAFPGNYLAGLPSVWLTPLVLAFGALRYNPPLQIYVTAIVAVGLLVAAVPTGSWVASTDQVSPAALPFFFAAPPNAMRLVMLVAAGVVLVVAVYRTRALLARAIDETRRRMNLTRYLPPQIAASLEDTGIEAARAGRRQMVAVLFTDVRGFTTMAETMDPSELGQFVSQFRHCVMRAADAHGGVIDKFIGDSALVVFGVPARRPDDARRALACGRAILDNVAAWSADRRRVGQQAVAIGVGIHWGEVFCGAVGDESRLEFTVLGDTVNVAARIEQTTKTAGYRMLASQDLLAAAVVDAGWTKLPLQTLRGRSQPITLFAWDEKPAPALP